MGHAIPVRTALATNLWSFLLSMGRTFTSSTAIDWPDVPCIFSLGCLAKVSNSTQLGSPIEVHPCGRTGSGSTPSASNCRMMLRVEIIIEPTAP